MNGDVLLFRAAENAVGKLRASVSECEERDNEPVIDSQKEAEGTDQTEGQQQNSFSIIRALLG